MANLGMSCKVFRKACVLIVRVGRAEEVILHEIWHYHIMPCCCNLVCQLSASSHHIYQQTLSAAQIHELQRLCIFIFIKKAHNPHMKLIHRACYLTHCTVSYDDGNKILLDSASWVWVALRYFWFDHVSLLHMGSWYREQNNGRTYITARFLTLSVELANLF